MKKRVFKADLSVKGIKKLQRELIAYKKKTLPELCKRYVERLAQEGVAVAQQNVGGFGKYITFSIQTNPRKDGCTALLLAVDSEKIISQWKTKEGMKSAEVSPLLMAEFGSGFGAENPMNVPGVGQGTFPSDTAKENAFKEEGWYWMDLDGTWKHSRGIQAKLPMYKASQRIQQVTSKVAREVFR